MDGAALFTAVVNSFAYSFIPSLTTRIIFWGVKSFAIIGRKLAAACPETKQTCVLYLNIVTAFIFKLSGKKTCSYVYYLFYLIIKLLL